MSYKYSPNSMRQLKTCDLRLQQIFAEVIEYVDCTIIEGHRGKERQNEAFRTGYSEIEWPNGTHNTIPSTGIDALAYPLQWNNIARNALFAGLVLGIALHQGQELIWGGDWNQNWDPLDNWIDAAHFELVT